MKCYLLQLAVAVLIATATFAGNPAQPGQVVHVTVHSAALEHNHVGDSPDREVSIYLPPGYDAGVQHYPTLYLLHGYTGTDRGWMNPSYVGLPELMNRLIAKKAIAPMIVVMPNSFNRFGGSFYANSELSGGWEEFIVHDLVAYVDAHYRTVADVRARGIAGHSMGGYGALRLGMQHPDVFSVAYGMSPCCAEWDEKEDRADVMKALQAKTLQGIVDAGIGPQSELALAAAFSPDLHNPPLGVSWPFDAQGHVVPAVAERWRSQTLQAIAVSYAAGEKHLQGLAFDVGRQDGLLDSLRRLDKQMTKLGIAHTYSEYEGTHSNRIRERMEKDVLPMFAKQLKAGT